MTRQEHLLLILGEECAEVAHAVSKALRFGLDDIKPGQKYTNYQMIGMEVNDLIAVLELLAAEGIKVGAIDDRFIDAKKEKVQRSLEYSAKRKLVSTKSGNYSQRY